MARTGILGGGVWHIDIPMTPEKVWHILKEKGVAESGARVDLAVMSGYDNPRRS